MKNILKIHFIHTIIICIISFLTFWLLKYFGINEISTYFITGIFVGGINRDILNLLKQFYI